MKRYNYFYAAVCMMLASILNLQAQTSVTVTSAGTLKSKLPTDYMTSVTHLIVNGPLNGTDILTIKSMRENLSILDLGNAQIVKDNENPYHVSGTTKYYTQKNVIGDFMFYAMTSLTRVVMPKDVFSIGSWSDSYEDPWYTDNGVLKLQGSPRTSYASEFDTSYGCAAFSRCINLKEVVFPTALVYIGPKAFSDCTSLTAIAIPEGVEIIGGFCFKGCIELATASLPSTLNTKKILDFYTSGSEYWGNTFHQCSKLSNVTLASGMTTLSPAMFRGCTALTSITLPNTLTTLESSVFYNCTALTALTIPASVTTIGGSAFQNCLALTEINLPEGINQISSHTFDNCSALTTFTMPNSVLTIDYDAFRGCSSLSQITLSTELNSISSGAFENCKALTSIILPEKLIAINSNVFANSGLKHITLPASVMTIAEGAFSSCKELESINLPANMMDIERETFSNCEKLSDIDLPSGLLTIKQNAFYNCKALKKVTLSGSIQSIEGGAFSNSGLEEVILKEGISALPEGTFAGCKYLKKMTFPKSMKTIGGLSGTSISELDFAEGAAPEVIGANAFSNCDSLRTLSLPASIKEIQQLAFNDCDNLKSVDLSHLSLTTIEEGTFRDCDSLKTVKLPTTVTEIKHSAFNNSKALETINLEDLKLTALGESAFLDCQNLKSVDLSKSTITEISSHAFASCRNLQTVKLPSTLKAIGQRGFSETIIDEMILPEGLTTIEHCAFGWTSSSAYGTTIKNIYIPESVTFIASGAFYNCAITGTLEIDPNENLVLDGGDFNSTSPFWGKSLNIVKWNSTKTFSAEKFGRVTFLYLPEGGSVTTTQQIDAVFYNGVTDKLTVAAKGSDKEGFYNYYSYTQDQDTKAKHVTFTKNFNTTSGYGEAQGWKTLVLPFDVTETYKVNSSYYNGETTYDTIYIAPFGSEALNAEGTLPYWLYELGADGNYKAATAIKAHTPYLICMPNNSKYPSEYNISGDITFAANNEAGVLLSKTEGALKRSVGTKFDLVPTYESLNKHDSIYVLNESNYYYADDKTYKNGSVFIKNYNENYSSYPAVSPFQAYLISKENVVSGASLNSPMYYAIGGGNGEITGIENPFVTPDQAVKVYARGGVLYIESNAARTIHIYNTAGQTVRVVEAQEGMNEVRGLGKGIYLLEGQKVSVK